MMDGFYSKWTCMNYDGASRWAILEDGYRVDRHPLFRSEAEADSYISEIADKPLTDIQRAEIAERAAYKAQR